MISEVKEKIEPLIDREKQVQQIHLYRYPLLESWGIFSGEISKSIVVSSLNSQQAYEDFFRQPNIAITSQIETFLNWLINHGVLIPDPAQVRSYLLEYFNLTRILRSTCKLAMDRLGMTSQLALEVYRDPEIDDVYLILYIRQHHYNQDILQQIEDLRLEYQVDLADSSGWFLVTTDFQPPL